VLSVEVDSPLLEDAALLESTVESDVELDSAPAEADETRSVRKQASWVCNYKFEPVDVLFDAEEDPNTGDGVVADLELLASSEALADEPTE
jgi:hypothetical protein